MTQKMRLAAVALLGCLLIVVVAAHADARPQRMAIPPQSLTIAARGSTEASAYCLDRARLEPQTIHNFRHVLRGGDGVLVKFDKGRSLTLAAAIEQNQIRIHGTGGYRSLQIENLTDGPATIQIQRSVIVGAHREPATDFQQLDQLLESAVDGSIQDRLWEHAQNHRSDRMRPLRDGQAEPADYLASPDRDHDLLWFTHGSDGTSQFVFQHRHDRLTLRTVDDGPGGVTEQRFTDLPRDEQGTLQPDARQLVQLVDDGRAARVAYRSAPEGERGLTFSSLRAIVDADAPHVEFMLGDQRISLPRVEFDAFLNGGAAPAPLAEAFAPEQPRRRVIHVRSALEGLSDPGIWIDPAAGRHTGYYDSARFMARLQETFGRHHDVFLDDDMELAAARVDREPAVRGGADIYILDDTRLVPADRAIIGEISDALRHVGMGGLDEPAGDQPRIVADNIVVITARKDADLRQLLHNYTEDGIFEDRLVVAFSCGEGGEATLNSNLLGAGDRAPRGILFYTHQIDEQAVQEVLLAASELLDRDGEFPSMRALVDAAVDRALDKASNEPIREAIQQMRRYSVQVSQAASPRVVQAV
ncbi:MAG: hypothetical protein WD009_14700 [Phycisphaeraceae bacterium]